MSSSDQFLFLQTFVQRTWAGSKFGGLMVFAICLEIFFYVNDKQTVCLNEKKPPLQTRIKIGGIIGRI